MVKMLEFSSNAMSTASAVNSSIKLMGSRLYKCSGCSEEFCWSPICNLELALENGYLHRNSNVLKY